MNNDFIDVPTLIHGDRVTWSLDEEGNIALRSTYGPGVTVYLEAEDIAAQQAAQAAWHAVNFVRANARTESKQIEIEINPTPTLAELDEAFSEATDEPSPVIF